MKHRHGHQRHILRVPPGPVTGFGFGVAQKKQGVVGHLHTLGPAGGAAGVHLQHHIVRCHRDPGITVALPVPPMGVAFRAGQRRLRQQNHRQLQLRNSRLQRLIEFRLGKHQHRLRITDNGFQLRRCQAPVQRRHYHVGLPCPQQQFKIPVGVLTQINHPGLWPTACLH